MLCLHLVLLTKVAKNINWICSQMWAQLYIVVQFSWKWFNTDIISVQKTPTTILLLMWFLLLRKDCRFRGMTNCQNSSLPQKYKYVFTCTHTNLKFGQSSACIRCGPCRILRSVQSTLMHQAKRRPTDIETMCDKMTQTTNMTSPWTTNL